MNEFPLSFRRMPLYELDFPIPFFHAPEPPETAVARQNPQLAAEMLKKAEEKRTFEIANSRGYDVASSYLDKLSPSRLSHFSSMQVNTYREESNGFFDFLFGSHGRITLDIRVR